MQELLVAFRADASTALGSGHVMRCVSLAQALRERGVVIHFLCRPQAGDLVAWLEDKGYPVTPIVMAGNAPDEEAESIIEALNAIGRRPDWLVIDHYGIDARCEQQLRPYAGSILVVDDLADRPHDCDLLLDQNFRTTNEDPYAGLVPDVCRVLLGPRYALLRPEFSSLRAAQVRNYEEVRRVIICFGGTDPTGETVKALLALHQPDMPPLAVDVVLGAASTVPQLLAEFLYNYPNVKLHHPATDMAALMASADLFIGAGGGMTWERCCLGLPSIVIAVAANQERGTAALARHGAVIYLGRHNEISIEYIADTIRLLVRNPGLREALGRTSAMIADGYGVRRVVQAMAVQKIQLRLAVEGDCELVFQWRNAEDVRRWSTDPEPISYAVHCRWYAESITDPNRCQLIGEHDGRPVGVLRYDISDVQARVSIYLAPNCTGQGLGTAMLIAGRAWMKAHYPEVCMLQADIRANNVASQAAFAAAGYHAEGVYFKHAISGKATK